MIGKMGKPLSWFDELDKYDRAYIVEYWRAIDKMTAIEQQNQEK